LEKRCQISLKLSTRQKPLLYSMSSISRFATSPSEISVDLAEDDPSVWNDDSRCI
jgi:hypothetical protein